MADLAGEATLATEEEGKGEASEQRGREGAQTEAAFAAGEERADDEEEEQPRRSMLKAGQSSSSFDVNDRVAFAADAINATSSAGASSTSFSSLPASEIAPVTVPSLFPIAGNVSNLCANSRSGILDTFLV